MVGINRGVLAPVFLSHRHIAFFADVRGIYTMIFVSINLPDSPVPYESPPCASNALYSFVRVVETPTERHRSDLTIPLT